MKNKNFYSFCLGTTFISTSLFSANIKCEQFKTYQDANNYYKAHKPDYQALDRNKNGTPCEHLKKRKKKKNIRLIIYKYGYPHSIGGKFPSLQSCEKKKNKLTISNIGLDYSYKCE